MGIEIKSMETDEEIKGKAFVHWSAWHEAYPALVSRDYLDRLTLQKCEQIACTWRDNILIAKDGERVVGFAGYGTRREEPNAGEIFAMYVLSDCYGTGVAQKLMEAALERLSAFPEVSLWVLKGNGRAIRFYEKCGFLPDGKELFNTVVNAMEIRMVLKKAREFAFTAVLHETLENGGAYVIFPWDIRKEFGKGRVKVHATFDGIPYDGSIVNMGVKDENGNVCYVIGVLKAIRKQLGKKNGDPIRVVITER